ncbi:FusB/FusC family EF-G-binding protein [Bacillus andreraoultii]|uniref:FusB/FusC family EF-G-binding protein n=1 Tax=Bacillus andreraoultii TaxID=1499685 RepID=UPI000539FC64|nr:elongation factor G-binding protein [Bacillus andreraoultii]
MQPFIQVDEFNYIREQVKRLVNAHSTTNDKAVLSAVKSIAIERVFALFSEIEDEQKNILQPITDIHDKETGEKFLLHVKSYVIPFYVTEQGIKKLFPKVKKLIIPSLEKFDLREVVYLSWFDPQTNKKYLVLNRMGKCLGVEGSFQSMNKKGVCAICNRHGEIGMFSIKEKRKGDGTFISRGNFICTDSQECNNHLMNLEKLYEFVDNIQK